MAQKPTFPPIGFLILGLLSLAASLLCVVRAFVVEGTVERIVSGVLFGVLESCGSPLTDHPSIAATSEGRRLTTVRSTRYRHKRTFVGEEDED